MIQRNGYLSHLNIILVFAFTLCSSVAVAASGVVISVVAVVYKSHPSSVSLSPSSSERLRVYVSVVIDVCLTNCTLFTYFNDCLSALHHISRSVCLSVCLPVSFSLSLSFSLFSPTLSLSLFFLHPVSLSP